MKAVRLVGILTKQSHPATSWHNMMHLLIFISTLQEKGMESNQSGRLRHLLTGCTIKAKLQSAAYFMK